MALDTLPDDHPPQPGHGLRAALAALASRTSGATVSVSVRCGEDAVAPAVELVAYAVAAEGVANAVAHGEAPVVEVDVRCGDGRLDVRVTDDGLGGARIIAGGGLETLARRVAALGGALTIESRAWAGTSVHAVFPLG